MILYSFEFTVMQKKGINLKDIVILHFVFLLLLVLSFKWMKCYRGLYMDKLK